MIKFVLGVTEAIVNGGIRIDSDGDLLFSVGGVDVIYISCRTGETHSLQLTEAETDTLRKLGIVVQGSYVETR